MPSPITGRWMRENVYAAGMFMVSAIDGGLVDLTARYAGGYAVLTQVQGMLRDEPIPRGIPFVMLYEDDSVAYPARFSAVRPKYRKNDEFGTALDLSTRRTINT